MEAKAKIPHPGTAAKDRRLLAGDPLPLRGHAYRRSFLSDLTISFNEVLHVVNLTSIDDAC